MTRSQFRWLLVGSPIVFVLSIMVLVVGCGGLKQPGYPFEQIPTSIPLLIDYPDVVYHAILAEGTRDNVYLERSGIGGFNGFYYVTILSSNGALIEETAIDAPDGYQPYRLLQCQPLVVWFRDPTEKRKDFFREAISAEEWQSRKRGAEDRLKEEIRQLEASGSNTEALVVLKARLKSIENHKTKAGK